ncbi:MAG: sel1 repeat family protein [Proteobacteria bacterium]|nr:sel1 repeat family protein [Pseudomonadota bacterium]
MIELASKSSRLRRRVSFAVSCSMSNCIKIGFFVVGLLVNPARSCAADAPSSDPENDPEVRKVLTAMHNASTWYHPDLYGLTLGMQYHAKHQYQDALKFFEIGALYADKLSQLSIGLMHLNGKGTAKDPVTAYAWFDLAAERNYPQFIATRDELKPALTPEQLAQAQALRNELGKRYGDSVAKHRLAVQLHQGLMNITGSRTGFNSGVVQISEVRCGPALVIGGHVIPQIGCGNDFLAKANWIPDLYFAARDREWMPNVSVGPLTDIGSVKSNAKKSDEAAAPNEGDSRKH